jgi:hypothetical protein
VAPFLPPAKPRLQCIQADRFYHVLVERLIGTVRRECLDRLVFWTAADLERKLLEFQHYTTSIARMRDGQGARRR